MLLVKTVAGIVIFGVGVNLVLQESTPYQYGLLPNLLCGAGAIITADGLTWAFRKVRSILTRSI